MLMLHCKRHYRNLATCSWCTTRREHVTKTAPARRRHSVGGGGGGGAPISYDRRRRRQQNVGGAAAAAHSSMMARQPADTAVISEGHKEVVNIRTAGAASKCSAGNAIRIRILIRPNSSQNYSYSAE